MTKEEFIKYNNVDENAIILEPWDLFSQSIIGITDDKQHLIYDYYKLANALSKQYAEDWYKDVNNPAEMEDCEPDFYDDACQWLDYNTIRSISYMNNDYKPIIMFETIYYKD